jgi:hypothetical protein
MPRILYKDDATATYKPPTSRSKPTDRKTKAVDPRPVGDGLMPSVQSVDVSKRRRRSKADVPDLLAAQEPASAADLLNPARLSAGIVPDAAVEPDELATPKGSGRKDEASRQEFLGQIAGHFPAPTTFTAAELIEKVPELGPYHSAYAFLQTARRRGLIEKAERGMFRLAASAAQEPQPDQEPATGPAPEPMAQAVENPTQASAIAAPVPSPEMALPPAERRNEQAEIATLLQLSRRYRSDRYFRLDDIVVPLRECRSDIYGKAEIGADEPPLCVVVGAYEPDPRVLNPPDIDVLFLDAEGQAHLRSASSWQFLPYRRKQG